LKVLRWRNAISGGLQEQEELLTLRFSHKIIPLNNYWR
jgi:hypothetical protein